jgi:DNA-binding Xre family transcriptional regulator
MTLKDVWEQKGLSPTQVAAQAGISTPTLYKMLHKEKVASRTIADVCRVLGITRKEYDKLEQG